MAGLSDTLDNMPYLYNAIIGADAFS